MKEHPILFSAPMVRVILDGRKTQTRRVVTPKALDILGQQFWPNKDGNWSSWVDGTLWIDHKCPYGIAGGHLWVKETYGVCWGQGALIDPTINYKADGWQQQIFKNTDLINAWRKFYLQPRKRDWNPDKWRSSLFMPRWASRITLKTTDIRVERLQDISEEDCKAEGITISGPTYADPAAYCPDPWEVFKDLWDSINAKKYPWESNPWVWVVEFEREEA